MGLGSLGPANTTGSTDSSRAAAIAGSLRPFPAGWAQLIAGDAPPPLPPGSAAAGRLRTAAGPLRAGAAAASGAGADRAGAVGGGAVGAVVRGGGVAWAEQTG
jgi:hypothetical protein